MYYFGGGARDDSNKINPILSFGNRVSSSPSAVARSDRRRSGWIPSSVFLVSRCFGAEFAFQTNFRQRLRIAKNDPTTASAERFIRHRRNPVAILPRSDRIARFRLAIVLRDETGTSHTRYLYDRKDYNSNNNDVFVGVRRSSRTVITRAIPFTNSSVPDILCVQRFP